MDDRWMLSAARKLLLSSLAFLVLGVGLVQPKPAGANNKMYWTNGSVLMRADRDGTNAEVLLDEPWPFTPHGIALDVANGKMYWTDRRTEKIRSADFDGSNAEDLVTITEDAGLAGIALDLVNGKMYWTDIVRQKIQRANLDGSNIEDLVTGWPWVSTATGYIALHSSRGKMYWTTNPGQGAKIMRANLDGTGVEELLDYASGGVAIGIALDLGGSQMYWTDYTTGMIRRARLNGANVEVLVTLGSSSYPYGIALDLANGKMYWTDISGMIHRANLDGSVIEDLVAGCCVEHIALDTPAPVLLPVPALGSRATLLLCVTLVGTAALLRRGSRRIS